MSQKKGNNKVEITFIKVEKTDAQYIIQLLKEHFKNDSVVDQKYKISYEDKFVLFPLVENKEIIDKLKLTLDRSNSYEIISREPIIRLNYKYKSLQEALSGKIPYTYFNLIPKSYDIIGNIAILEFDKPSRIDDNEFSEYRNLIAKAVIKVNKNV
ncbi:MAG: hypothetical protein KAX18_07250, partial [Candidatus Lokiarchaeota archaeon]|nr:hypothetical protein [Candidatus Lokiarchaeota archaeon]